jgi:DNA repair protein RecN (Recombination protein N)
VGLAITVAAATTQPVGTLVFDEADSGVGGAVAELIGRLMRRLGEVRQVLCVTHLPQVAARAHQHFEVIKRTADGRPLTSVHALDEDARIEEIARMLGGVEITATTRSHARELLAP